MNRRGARLGQHFLTNSMYAKKLAEAARAGRSDTVLEIGPGKGVLTKELLRTGAHVVAIEKDETLVELLHTEFAAAISHKRFELIEGDVRDFDPKTIEGDYALAANIPYYITGEIIRQFLTASHQPKRMALLVQKEVAERIVAGNGKESILSLSVKVYGNPSIVAKVSKGNFLPPPSVDSAMLLVDDISKIFFDSISEENFFKVVRAGFSSKRKMLLNNLGHLFGKENVAIAFAHCAMQEKTRAEDVPLPQWKRLVEQLM